MAMAKFIFDGTNKLFIARSGVTAFDVQIDLYSDWKELLISDTGAMKYEQALRTVGGDDLTAGRTLGDTYFLINGWKIRPQETSHTLSIDGNLFSDDGSGVIIPTTGNYNVLVEQFQSNLVDSTVAQLDITNLQYLIESQRHDQRGFGSIYYVDPAGGSDTSNNGMSPDEGFATITKAHTEVTSGQGDVIFVIHQGSGQITHHENAVITKSDLSIRGPGNAIILKCADGISPTLNIHARNVNVDGFIFQNPVGCKASVEISGDFCGIHNCLFQGSGNVGILNLAGEYLVVRDTFIQNYNTGIAIASISNNSPDPPLTISQLLIERDTIFANGVGILATGNIQSNVVMTSRVSSNNTGIVVNSNSVFGFVVGFDNIVDNIYTNVTGNGLAIRNEIIAKPIEIIETLKESTWTHTSGTSSVLFQDAVLDILTMAKGRIVNSSSGVFDFYDQDNTNVVFTLVESGIERYRS